MARNKYPEQTVQKILAEAGELFMKQGYDNTSLDDIAKSCGVTKGAIYHHFASKEDLLVSMMENYETDDEWFNEIKNNSNITAIEKLRQIFDHELSNVDKIKVDAIFQPGLKDPKILAKQLELTIHNVAPMIEDLLYEGLKDGSIKVDQPKQVAEMMVILINIWINPGVFSSTKDETIDKVRFLNNLLIKLGIDIFSNNLDKLMENYWNELKK